MSQPLRSAQKSIEITGARMHNLKNVSVTLPRNRLVVVTGVSGSGKSSLVFDTLYAEGHRRYVESLSAYARQFLSRMPKPDVDLITGLSPAIAIEQRTNTSNPRSTVGSITEIYDYLRLLFARMGRMYSPVSGEEVTCHSVTDVVDFVVNLPEDGKVFVLTPFSVRSERTLAKELEITLQRGFSRLFIDGKIVEIADLLSFETEINPDDAYLLIDRFIIRDIDEAFQHRAADSVQTAFNEGRGRCWIKVNDYPPRQFSEIFEADGMVFEKPTEQLFNFNNPIGACPTCEGFGRTIGIDPALVIPNPALSVYEGAVKPWSGDMANNYQTAFLKKAAQIGFPIHKPYLELSPEQKDLLWNGSPEVLGIADYFKDIAEHLYKVQNRVIQARYRGYTECPDCKGTRLRKETQYIKIDGFTIGELLTSPINDAYGIVLKMQATHAGEKLGERLFDEITNRLRYLTEVGLGYLNLGRKAATLSGGETQRINLATSLGSNLVGSLYILDEPSVGLHPRDGDRLIHILESLRDMGNTVIVVEHDEAMMQRSNYLIDMGPLAGEHGGQAVAAGTFDEVAQNPDSLTAKYLSGAESIPLPEHRRTFVNCVRVVGAMENNLKNLTVDFPLGVLTVVTGVSGSGKTTLVKKILFPALSKKLSLSSDKPGLYKALEGAADVVTHIELLDQSSVGKNLRSNPVTYVGAYDGIRDLYANQTESKARHLRSLHFSFNVPGGRCDACEGEGVVTVQMQFLPDVKLLCETCHGKRFKEVVLEVQYKEKNIDDVLKMTVTEALTFFKEEPKIINKLKPLEEVGLGYIRLGQSSSTLSGGELQRLKLATFLTKKTVGHTVYIFDEPTTGLHFHDVKKLMTIFQTLVKKGNTVIIIEHHLDVIKCADWLIDLGPEGGDAGGNLVGCGTPEQIAQIPESYTGQFLKEKLK